jgi:predicted glycogen debranching enzyme
MGYLQFDKSQLINLEYSLSREILRSNRAGSFATTTIIGCNTRKYHGLLICPCHKTKSERFLLLSSLDATVIQHGQEFNLGIHKYQGDLYIPRGHKYIRDYTADIVGKTLYRVGGVILERESIMVEKEEQILIKFTLVDAHSHTTLRFKPFLAFRELHNLSKASLYANTKYKPVANGIMNKLYDGFPGLYMQFSKKIDFVPVPDWYYNIEYIEEQKRGYDFKEDLFVPGYFECNIKKGESIVFSASIKEMNPTSFKTKYTKEVAGRIPRNSFKNCLLNSAEQFIVKKEKGTEIIAGYPWFGSWGRDTFISLPGLTLPSGNTKLAKEVIDTMILKMKGGLFPNMGEDDNPAFNSVDAPMWFIWSLQQYEKYDTDINIWKSYGKTVKDILQAFRDGTTFNIRMLENGLIYAGEEGKALTWMDAVNSTGPVTPRMGTPVEINALWYNNVSVALKWAEESKDSKFVKEWKDLPGLTADSFIKEFWSEEKGYLADVVNNSMPDFAVRPNQVIAAALEYTPLSKEMRKGLLDVVKSELLTPKGLRTLSPKNPQYQGVYEGDQNTRDAAYHQGTVWPWLLEHFVKAYMDVHKNSGISLARQIYRGFEEEMTIYGIGSIAEIYDGDPPHAPRGAISQAWSVAALLRIDEMIEKYERTN